jgi:hypothetical protein
MADVTVNPVMMLTKVHGKSEGEGEDEEKEEGEDAG